MYIATLYPCIHISFCNSFIDKYVSTILHKEVDLNESLYRFNKKIKSLIKSQASDAILAIEGGV